ncbi:MAG TPA: MFS transporter [Candidatus Limnocylindrales bacterium]|nr:MFS transporter [Candidatus Limnocylindrales bacterium]
MDAAPANDGLWSPHRRGLTVGLVLTITLVAFEALAVSTVMPQVARELGGIELYGWVFSSFFLASLIGIVVVGGAIDRRGLAIPFAVGLGLFATGLVVGGLAPSMPVLVGARFVQGLGAGTIPPIAYVAIGRSLPEHLRARMFATMSTAWILPGVLGPAIAATIGQALSWRYVFLGLLPLIALAGALTIGALRAVAAAPGSEDAEADASAADRARLPLAIQVAAGAGLVTAGLTSGVLLPTIFLIGLGLPIGIHALRQLTPPGTLRARPVLPAAILLRGILTFMFFGIDAFVSLVLVEWRGLSLTEAGVALTAATIVWTAGSWVQARGSTRWPSYRFVQVGFAFALVGLAGFMLVLRQDVSWLVAIPTFAVAGFGMGLAYSPIALIVLREATPADQGSASSALSLTDSLGTALGTGVTGAIVAAGIRSAGKPVPGLAVAFAVALGVGLGGLLLTGRLHRRTALPAAGVPARATPRT